METIKVYTRPDVTVQISNIRLDFEKNLFSLDLGTRSDNRKKFVVERIEGKFGMEFKHYFTQRTPVKVKVDDPENPGTQIFIKTGELKTGFEKYLAKRGIEFVPGILTDMVFTAENNSENYAEFPFKIIRYKSMNSLTLVNIGTKKKVSSFNPNTGEVKDKYYNKTFTYQGKVHKEYFPPKYYTRLVIETSKEVETV